LHFTIDLFFPKILCFVIFRISDIQNCGSNIIFFGYFGKKKIQNKNWNFAPKKDLKKRILHLYIGYLIFWNPKICMGVIKP
jgi:hypothetical protein